jgi:hypothetical protein
MGDNPRQANELVLRNHLEEVAAPIAVFVVSYEVQIDRKKLAA